MPANLNSYIGRFAPSPTGCLHLGSLYTALASYLDAKSHQGLWLIRIDDLDTPRNVEGATHSILSTLEALGLYWDGSVDYQSLHLDDYHDALAGLSKKSLLYPCVCSRKQLGDNDIYPGTCRNKNTEMSVPHALRIKADGRNITFDDMLQGTVTHDLPSQDGDFIVKRKDGIIAYQFAVVLDDLRQGVNQVVRGFDLLDSTPKQIYLHQHLGLTIPNYMHVPVINDAHGFKLSKQTLATAVDIREPGRVIFDLLVLLSQQPPEELRQAGLEEVLMWAVAHWNPQVLKQTKTLPSDEFFALQGKMIGMNSA